MLLGAGASLLQLFILLAVVNGLVAIYICGLLPDEVIKAILVRLLRLCFRVEARGVENFRAAGARAVIVCNHVSFLDAILIAVFLPQKPLFAVNTTTANLWWVRLFLSLVDAYPLDPSNPMSTKGLIKAVKEGQPCVIFPEGRITVTGALMKIYEGPGMIADKADATVLPVRIDGAQYTRFSRLKGKVRLRWFPKITMTFLPPRQFELPDGVSGRQRRKAAGAKLYDVMSEMMFETCDYRRPLFDALLDAKRIHGGGHKIVQDPEGEALGYGGLVTGAWVLGRKFAKLSAPGEVVGLLLPNSKAAVAAFFGLQAFGRVPAMLNFSTGVNNMISAVNTAKIKRIVTSRRFVELGNLTHAIEALSGCADVIDLEDIRDDISLTDKLKGVLSSWMPGLARLGYYVAADDPAVVLFTSGSEGTPKAVVLSHTNLLANRYQLAARIEFNATDVAFNALPIFHSFGLTAGLLLPLFSGIRTYLYPSPLHYRVIPALVYDTDATMMFGTDTFLAGYARVADPYDFYSLRYVFAGAEKVKDETRRIWFDKFGIRIFEGYGATETAPVLAANNADALPPGLGGAVSSRHFAPPGTGAGY